MTLIPVGCSLRRSSADASIQNFVSVGCTANLGRESRLLRLTAFSLFKPAKLTDISVRFNKIMSLSH